MDRSPVSELTGTPGTGAGSSGEDAPAAAPGTGADGDDVEVGDDGDVGDDVIVLSWWQHPVNVVVVLVGTALLAGMIGWLVADTTASDEGGDVDVGFLQDMRVHHEQAVAMSSAFLDDPGTDPALRTVAREIQFAQAIDIGRMIQLLRGFGAAEAPPSDEAMAWMGMPTALQDMPGLASDEELDALAAAEGGAADELFVTLMTAHHRGGMHMAEYAAEHAESAEVRAMASSMVDSQAGEIVELDRLRAGGS